MMLHAYFFSLTIILDSHAEVAATGLSAQIADEENQ